MVVIRNLSVEETNIIVIKSLFDLDSELDAFHMGYPFELIILELPFYM